MYNPHTKPYWNADMKKAHTKERNMRRVWMQDGRPRGMQHESYFNYKLAKRDFRNIQKLANDDINNAAECDIRLFWKLIKHNNIVHTSPESICNAFANYFEDLYTPTDTSTFDDPTLNEIVGTPSLRGTKGQKWTASGSASDIEEVIPQEDTPVEQEEQPQEPDTSPIPVRQSGRDRRPPAWIFSGLYDIAAIGTTSVVEWTIVEPPIVFGKTARLYCKIEIQTNSTPTWTGGANFSLISFHGSTTKYYEKKYRVTNRQGNDKFESVLEIFNFSESDVNCDYSCSFGLYDFKKKLRLADKSFIYPIEQKTTTVLSTLRNGYLDVTLELRKVYPVPKCKVHLNEEEVTNRLKTSVWMNGIFYYMTETLHHYFNDETCTGNLTISCDVGVKRYSVHQNTLNTCTGVTKEENKKHIPFLSIEWTVVGGIIAVIITSFVCIVALVVLSKHGKLQDVMCCKVSWSGESNESDIRTIFNQMMMMSTKSSNQDVEEKIWNKMLATEIRYC
ncbi:unnamed protein product [Mytilus coruscus]|uniref:Uncharacterized protein n=1 Tax=Mytilus coruscus TaxID=42192 RepID=A0A6J8DMN9_MYTCO|nr:unnamed protein product [Mytilus coruscus]